MINDRLRDNNGDNFTSYHQRHFSHFTGFPGYNNTNIDKVCQFLDEPAFQSFLDLQEQDKAYDINYAHGLELDDEFGDPYGINRNGLDDTTYRFVLKCHMLAIKCDGTLPSLIHLISSVLNCSKDDVTLGLARHYTKTGQLVGEPDTILIKNINIKDVPNDHLVPLLSNQLQYAIPADKRLGAADFYNIIPNHVYTGCTVSVHARAVIPISSEIRDNVTIPVHAVQGITVSGHANATINEFNK